MEELLKIAYNNFMETENGSTSKSGRLMREKWAEADQIFEKLESILNPNLFNEIYDQITDSFRDIQEAAFIAGFAYCAKFLTNGKTDLLPND